MRIRTLLAILAALTSLGVIAQEQQLSRLDAVQKQSRPRLIGQKIDGDK